MASSTQSALCAHTASHGHLSLSPPQAQDLERRVSELTQEVAAFSGVQERTQALQAENARLKSALNLGRSSQYKVRAACALQSHASCALHAGYLTAHTGWHAWALCLCFHDASIRVHTWTFSGFNLCTLFATHFKVCTPGCAVAQQQHTVAKGLVAQLSCR